MQASPKTLLISIPIGVIFPLYLFVAYIAIPAGAHPSSHDNVGNELVGAVFFSYMSFVSSLSIYAVPTIYTLYAYVGLARLRRVGLILFALHYGFAALVAVPAYLKSIPGLLDVTKRQMGMLAERPGTILFCFGPFIIANVWYLARLLRNDE